MWLGKFLDLEEDLIALRSRIKENIFKNIKKVKLTPLEFTILESIFNSKEISGYDLMLNLNNHFAGTWTAASGTIYPILSKLSKYGFLGVKAVKSPIGPLKKLYYLTKAGELLLKGKVNTNFLDQIQFCANFLRELSIIYIFSYPEDIIEDKIVEVQNTIQKIFKDVVEILPSRIKQLKLLEISICPNCENELERKGVSFCPYCGIELLPTNNNDSVEKDF